MKLSPVTRLALAATLSATIASVTPTPAGVIASGCGGSFVATNAADSCQFALVGAGFQVEGDATATVGCCGYIMVTVEDLLGNVLFHCRADSGNGETFPPARARCRAGSTTLSQGGLVQSNLGVPILCKVEARGAGTYSCSNYLA